MLGEDYLRSLDDGREVYFEGDRVKVVEHPILGESARSVAEDYDRLAADSEGATRATSAPRNARDLAAQVASGHSFGLMAHLTHTSLMTLLTAAERLESSSGESAERIRSYVAAVQEADLRLAQCITDAKGNRSLAPAMQLDRDSYVHVVDRSADGVVIRGAKLHITGAALAHDLMTIPTKAMKPGEEDYAIACVVPVGTPGVRIVNTTYAPRLQDRRSHPVSSRNHYPEGFVIFDDVFVPYERVVLDGVTSHAAVFAHSLGMWERLGALSLLADEADTLVGLAELIARANGTEKISHIKEKIAEMIIHATLVRGALEASIARCEIGRDGVAFPSELFVNAGKYHAAAHYSIMARNLIDIAGGSVMTAPSVADLENPDVGTLLRKYMAGSEPEGGEWRARLFHTIRDLTADSYGGYKQVTNVHAGGGLFAQRLVSRKHYDLDRATRLAAELVRGEGH